MPFLLHFFVGFWISFLFFTFAFFFRYHYYYHHQHHHLLVKMASNMDNHHYYRRQHRHKLFVAFSFLLISFLGYIILHLRFRCYKCYKIFDILFFFYGIFLEYIFVFCYSYYNYLTADYYNIFHSFVLSILNFDFLYIALNIIVLIYQLTQNDHLLFYLFSYYSNTNLLLNF